MEATAVNGSVVKFTKQIRQRVDDLKASMQLVGKPRYIYFLLEPDNDTVRYVGCCTHPETRYRTHVGSTATARIKEWVDSLKSRGELPRMRVVAKTHAFGRYDELDFGWGTVNHFSGFVCNGMASSVIEKWLIAALSRGSYCSNDHPDASLLNVFHVPKKI